MLSNIPTANDGEAHELRSLFEKQLKELYWTEKTMVPMLSATISMSTSKDLVKVLESHRVETLSHISRLEKLFAIAGIEAGELKYAAVECLIKEGEGFIESIREGVVRDAGIISVLQKIEHYEISCYGTMRAYAIALREEDAVTLLEQTLEEEKAADIALSAIAESHINTEAADKEI